MVNVSNEPLGDSTEEYIREQFADFLAEINTDQAESFLDSFFTESEQIMFIKRLAIVMMLDNNVPYAHIAEMLKVSTSTVKKTDERVQDGDFDDFHNQFATSDRVDRFWNIVRAIIDSRSLVYGSSSSPAAWLDRL